MGVLTPLKLFLTIPGPLGSREPTTDPGHAQYQPSRAAWKGYPSTCWQSSLILSYLSSPLQPYSHQTIMLTTLIAFGATSPIQPGLSGWLYSALKQLENPITSKGVVRKPINSTMAKNDYHCHIIATLQPHETVRSHGLNNQHLQNVHHC